MNYLLLTFLGILTWPVLEYLLHRYLGHVLKINTLFKKEHTRHHAETNYFAPLNYKLFAALPVCLVTMTLGSLIFNSWSLGLAYTSGFMGMFSVYEWVHWSFHAKAPKTNLGLKLRKHHFAHHFQNPKMNHGVTTTFIDKIAGTYICPEIIKVPKNIALPWLFDKDGKNIDSNYQNDFQFK